MFPNNGQYKLSSSLLDTIVTRLRFCPAPPPIVVIVVVIADVVIVIVVVVYGAIAVAIALALTIDFNDIATIAVINIKRNWGAVIILLLLASGQQPSGQQSGRLALAADAITVTANAA
jgi:hypothetical protein